MNLYCVKNRKYIFRKWRKVDTFFHKFRLLYWKVYIEPYRWFPNFTKTLCKQNVKTIFLSILVALNVKWVPHLKVLQHFKNYDSTCVKSAKEILFSIFIPLNPKWARRLKDVCVYHFLFCICLLVAAKLL